MRIVCLALTCLLALPAVSHAAIIITEVMSSSSHPGGTSNSDWFELTNSGVAAVDITGWSWDDDSATPGIATFGAITSIGAGESIIVTQETLGEEAAWRTDWNVPASVQVVNLGASGIPGFSSNGDTIYIYDAANNEVTSRAFSTATNGSTFEWDVFDNDLGLSVAGENGAYVASFNGDGFLTAGSDIGSPGYAAGAVAVPEPSSTAALMLAIGGVAFRRFRKKNA